MLTAADTRPLAGTFWRGGDQAIVVAGATGVERRHYDAFARHAAAAGWSVLTFDYRGIGGSRDRPLRHDRATMADWGRWDLDAAIRFVQEQGCTPHVVAHSVGGQLLPLAPRAKEVRAALLVASQSGHWRLWSRSWRPRLLLLWYVLIPLLTRLLGRFPSSWFGLGKDLPAGVARQWAYWGRHRDYLAGRDPAAAQAYHAFRAPMCLVHVADDHGLAPAPAVHALAGHYGRPDAVRVLDPLGGAAAGAGGTAARPIGHFGFFRRGMEDAWDAALGWLAAPQGEGPWRRP